MERQQSARFYGEPPDKNWDFPRSDHFFIGGSIKTASVCEKFLRALSRKDDQTVFEKRFVRFFRYASKHIAIFRIKKRPDGVTSISSSEILTKPSSAIG